MLLEPKTAPCPPEVDSPQDLLKSNKAVAEECPVNDKDKDNAVRFDMSGLSARRTSGTKKLDRCSHYSDKSDCAATAECSISSGENFSLRSLNAMPPRDSTSAKVICRQRSILRTESPMTQAQGKFTLEKKSVKFGTVLVRDYEIILGDHPCCSYGPPVTIDWDYHEYEPLDVDKYEFEALTSRRSLRDMMLNYYQRKHLLKDDYTEVDFKATKKVIKRIKSQRHITRKLAPCYQVEAALESACRKFKRAVIK